MQQINQQYRTVAGVLQHGFAAPPGVRAAAASVARLATSDAAGRQPASAPFHPHEFLPLFGPCVGASLCTGGCSASHDDTEYYWELCPFMHVIQAASEAERESGKATFVGAFNGWNTTRLPSLVAPAADLRAPRALLEYAIAR